MEGAHVVLWHAAGPTERAFALPTEAACRLLQGTFLGPAAARGGAAQLGAILRAAGCGTDAALGNAGTLELRMRAAVSGGRLLVVLDRAQRRRIQGSVVSGETPAEAPAEAPAPRPEPRAWIELSLRDQDGEPVGYQRYRLELPDGSVREGRLDPMGFARVDGIDPGTCKISFPDIHDDEWGR
jgi:hypothetical protein